MSIGIRTQIYFLCVIFRLTVFPYIGITRCNSIIISYIKTDCKTIFSIFHTHKRCCIYRRRKYRRFCIDRINGPIIFSLYHRYVAVARIMPGKTLIITPCEFSYTYISISIIITINNRN